MLVQPVILLTEPSLQTPGTPILNSSFRQKASHVLGWLKLVLRMGQILSSACALNMTREQRWFGQFLISEHS